MNRYSLSFSSSLASYLNHIIRLSHGGGSPRIEWLSRNITQYQTTRAVRFVHFSVNGSCDSRNMSKYKIVMVRHGESEWNKLNLFCGWYDADLSDKGKCRPNVIGLAYCVRYSRAKGRVILIVEIFLRFE